MEPDRLPREILYGELRGGARKVGRPLLRYKDTIKHDLKAVKIKTNSWEDAIANYDAWRLDIKTQVLGAGDNGFSDVVLHYLVDPNFPPHPTLYI